ncbi:DSH, C-terminal domain and P-loop containing nucleoside triphosphate hydrolase domain-containing protein [Strongyloides ratti]|uniref:DSH, C-terminal domain and P-loop containing nucleoside triphosphate hydrolase domain-containing protein n=1 Tax=Strongyloides ratti TaxID=34506 RepID=A0A090MR14_STRRB|nr:DSH, C-terminal domain and P-loop containing nucleoside triphosphate hydrolase domain-containing protein [Strongyloides ratti]CEF60613.1 DSH, C-terminal domain and P-loop containing nucleoside triphosphate hydrolase domain-containing protein [Strongyloides ratti]
MLTCNKVQAIPQREIVAEQGQYYFEEDQDDKNIKVLFTTETLAVGLNSPVKFMQIAVKAGRRGIDEKGYVIIMTNAKLNVAALKNILTLKSSVPMNSQLSVTYNFVFDKCGFSNYKEFLENSFKNYQKNSFYANTAIFKKRKEVFKELNFINENNELTKKGMIAANISYVEGSMILAELIESNNLLNKRIDAIAATFSLFVCSKSTSKEKSQKASESISAVWKIQKKINEIEKKIDFSKKEMLEVKIYGEMYEKVQDLVNGKTIFDTIESSEIYALILLKVIKDIKKLFEEIIKSWIKDTKRP